MPRYFSVTWLTYMTFCVAWTAIEFRYEAVVFLVPIVLSGFFFSLLVTLIVARVAKWIGINHDPFVSKIDWKDDD
jgi:hypothetical protein